MEHKATLSNQTMTSPSDPLIPQSSKPKQGWLKRVAIFVCWVLVQLSWTSWFLTSTWIEQGFWTLPIGLLFIPVQWSSFFGCVGLLMMKRWAVLPFLFVNLWLIKHDIAVSFSKNFDKEDIGVMTWNIEGKTALNDGSSCVTDFINKWQTNGKRQILIIQEVPQNKVRSLEQSLNLSCSFQTYEQGWTLGAMVCSDPKWTIKPWKQRPLDNTGYRYLFVELMDQETQGKINVLNLHLQSLAKVAIEDKVPQSKDVVTQVRRAFTSPRKYLGLLTDQNIEHQKSILKVGTTQTQLKDPSIIAGDFNTPPQVPIHKKMRELNLQDAHLERGLGWGFTISKFGLIFSRIDFLYATEQLNWVGRTQTHSSVTCSDHKPITAWIDADFLQ